jgi:uncharacterized protein YrrD
MESEVRVMQTPRFETDYWLCRCVGFEVDSPEGRLGIVEWVVFRSRHDRPDALAVQTGHLLHRSVLIAVTDVASVLPEEGRITVASNSVQVKRERTLRSRLASGTASKPNSPSPTP